MSKPTILFADNNSDFSETLAEFLKTEGFEVITASDPTEARRKLEQAGIDLAILDIRLLNDDDERDHSGLLLAKEFAQRIPIVVTSAFPTPTIMLTSYPSYENVREALTPIVGELPPAVDFIAKAEGPEALLRAIKKALEAKQARPPTARVQGTLNVEQRWRPVVALIFLAGAVLSGIIAIISGEPTWLAGTTALGILYAVITWITVQGR